MEHSISAEVPISCQNTPPPHLVVPDKRDKGLHETFGVSAQHRRRCR